MTKFWTILLLIAFSIPVLGQRRANNVPSKEDQLNKKYCSPLFNTSHAEYIDLLHDNGTQSARSYTNILDWLQGRVAGLQVYAGRNNTRIPYLRNQRAGIYVDEIWMDADYLSMLSVSDIGMVKIMKGPVMGPRSGPGGIIAIYTIREEDLEEEE